MILQQPYLALILLASAIAIYFPVPTWLIGVVFTLGALLYVHTLLSSNQLAILAIVIGIPLIAFFVPIPLPEAWPPLIRLAIVIGLWVVVLTVSISLLLIYDTRHRAEEHQK